MEFFMPLYGSLDLTETQKLNNKELKRIFTLAVAHSSISSRSDIITRMTTWQAMSNSIDRE